MSSRRSRPRQPSSPTTATDERAINELVMKLRAVLPGSRIPAADRASAARVLQETCDYIRSLQQEVGDLSERLSELLAAGDSGGGGGGAAAAADEAASIIRSLLAHDMM